VNLPRVPSDQQASLWDSAMNHSLLSADRNTHLKVVCVALLAAFVVVAVGVGARVADGSPPATGGLVLKAGKPAVYTRGDLPAIR